MRRPGDGWCKLPDEKKRIRTALKRQRIGRPDGMRRLGYTAGSPPGTEPTALAIARSSAVVTHAVDHSVM